MLVVILAGFAVAVIAALIAMRAQAAESRLQAIATRGGGGDAAAEERVSQLEAENAALRARLTDASERTGKVLDRVRFLRQQHEASDR